MTAITNGYQLAAAYLVALGAALGVGAGLGAIANSQTDEGRPDCIGPVVLVHDNQPLDCDVNPPQTLTIMGVTSQARCDDIGGDYLELLALCENVDY